VSFPTTASFRYLTACKAKEPQQLAMATWI